jgi:hypothetical protein
MALSSMMAPAMAGKYHHAVLGVNIRFFVSMNHPVALLMA